MRRKNRRPFNEKRETNKMLIISSSVLVIAIASFVLTYVIYSNYLNNQKEIAQAKRNNIIDLGNVIDLSSSQASSSIGKTVNEVEQEEINEKENKDNSENEVEINKIAINTSNMEKESIDKNQVVSKTEEIKKEEVVVPDPTFIKPVEGEIITGFAKENLIYSSTLQEWVTHNGIDIKAEKTSIVKASSEGTIKSIKNDPRYGITVVIEHANGFVSIYSNLLTAEFVKEDEVVKQGQTIGTVGNTATFEIADESHLHFEILKNDEQLNPEDYIK